MRYHNITKDDMLNGDGLRVVLWVAGCDHCCKDCQNPVTWDPNGGLEFDAEAKAELFEALDHDYISGITFSGGDPLFYGNREDVTLLAKEVKDRFPGKNHMALYRLYLRDYPDASCHGIRGCFGGRRICRRKERYQSLLARQQQSACDRCSCH